MDKLKEAPSLSKKKLRELGISVRTVEKNGEREKKKDGKHPKNPIPLAYFYFDGMGLSVWLNHPNIVWSGGNLTLVVIHVPSLNSIG